MEDEPPEELPDKPAYYYPFSDPAPIPVALQCIGHLQQLPSAIFCSHRKPQGSHFRPGQELRQLFMCQRVLRLLLRAEGAPRAACWTAVFFGMLFGAVAPIAAQPLERYEIFNTVVRNPTNGHYYELIRLGSATRTFAESSAAAGAKSYQGIPGHLVTITSQAEQDFIDNTYQRAGNYQVWMGASDSAIEGEWRWVTGPEAGQLFWRTGSTNPVITGVAFGFESWGAFRDQNQYWEPSNGGGLGNDEDYATFTINRSLQNITRWNDLPGEYSRGLRDWVQCYMVEYSIPEPASMTLMVLAALALPRLGHWRAAC